MNIDVITVGKIKEAYLRDAISEYLKRLSKFARVTVIEVKDEKTEENATDGEERNVKETEGKRILQKIGERDYVIALAINGETFTSEGMAERLNRLFVKGESRLTFVIGGSLGLSDEVLSRANESWSFGKLTYPHQLMRVILLEQLYRDFKILNHEPYHK